MGQPINYPYRKFRYEVVFQGGDMFARTSFSEVSGIGQQVQVVEYRNGNDLRNTPRKYPGLTTFSNVTFRWGQCDDTDLISWICQVAPSNEAGPTGLVNRVNIQVTLMTDDGKPGVVWTLLNCWPVSYTAPDLNAMANEIAITSLEVCCEGIIMDSAVMAGAPSQI